MSSYPQHVLCFTDLLSITKAQNTCLPLSSSKISTHTEERHTHNHDHHSAILFVREDNKKCSFILKNPVSLIGESCDNFGEDSFPKNISIPSGSLDAAPSNSSDNKAQKGVEKLLACKASITSCKISSLSESNMTHEIFLFGGFELITNVKTVEVYVSQSVDALLPSSKPCVERYLTTCKGFPVRDLPPLVATTISMNKNLEAGDEKMLGNAEFFKFVLALPGGAKPMESVILKFLGLKSIIVRNLKVKGKLTDSTPAPTSSQVQISKENDFLLDGKSNSSNSAIWNEDGTNDGINTNQLLITTTSGRSNAIEKPSVLQEKIQQVTKNLRLFDRSPQQQQHLGIDHEQEKKHAETINAIAGIGIYLRHSEDRTISKLESLLANMETRILERLDDISMRMNVIEQSVLTGRQYDTGNSNNVEKVL